MKQTIFVLSLLALFGVNHYVECQGLNTTASVKTTTTDSAILRTENAAASVRMDEKEGSGTTDPFQDILFDPSLIVARVNRDVSDEKSIWPAVSNDTKDEESSNTLEDLNTQETKYYSEPNWYRRQDWIVDEERPTYKRESSYNRFLKYPIFSGR